MRRRVWGCVSYCASNEPVWQIGLVVLASAVALGNLFGNLLKGSNVGDILRETLVIGGWVSMWRPLEIFLYDWWPIRNEARLSDRLAAMPVRIEYLNAAAHEAWKGNLAVAVICCAITLPPISGSARRAVHGRTRCRSQGAAWCGTREGCRAERTGRQCLQSPSDSYGAAGSKRGT